jgi:hypothetical protein
MDNLVGQVKEESEAQLALQVRLGRKAHLVKEDHLVQ